MSVTTADPPPSLPAQSLVAHRVRLARELARLPPERVWREVGIPPRLLDMYERGVLPIRPDHLAGLAACLDVPQTWLERPQ